MDIHFTDLATLYPSSPKDILQETVDPINATLAKYDISTGSRIAAFIAQVGHESAGFTAMMENLNYSAATLGRVFPSHFPTEDICNAYAHNPQKIANRAYGSRMGNGNEASGDGWKFRGRGFVQITGKSNYELLAKALNMSLDDTCAYLETREGAAMSSGWFWDCHSCNTLADQGKFRTITLRINGGLVGEDDREAHYLRAKKMFGA